MKRAFPQKVKPVPSRVSDDTVVDQSRQALPEVTRRVSTSAAMIGLAISVGTPSLLLTQDEAMAAEPVGSEPVVAATPSTFDATTSSSDADVSVSTQAFLPSDNGVIEHTVQEGQSIWQLAQIYGVDAVTVAAVNQVPLDTVLRVGQVLKIPSAAHTVRTLTPDNTDSSAPGYYGPIAVAPSTDTASGSDLLVNQDRVLKADQDVAVDRLRQKQDNLRLGLAKLKTVNRNVVPSELSKPVEQTIEVETAGVSSYRVAPGDTLSAIARAHGVSPSELAKANQISDPNFIFVDQVLSIPQSGTSDHNTSAPVAGAAVVPNLVAMSSTTAPLAVPVITADTAPESNSVPSVVPMKQSGKSEFKAQIASVPSQPSTTQPGADVVAIGGQEDVPQVAVAPYAVSSPAAEGDSVSGVQRNYVENLKQEILKLREKYRVSGSQLSTNSQSGTRVAAVNLVGESAVRTDAASTRVNPEFNPSDRSESLRTQVRQLQNRVQMKQAAPQSGAPESASLSQPQIVATAPLGSESYEPLVPSSLGQTVSPNLPPLGAVENYLPKATGQFNGYIWPTRGVLTSGYGWRWGRMHKGIDIAAPIGTPIVAAAPGVVITAGWNSGGYGNLVEIQHPDGSVTLYAHNDRILVREGQQVEQGQQIANMGSTGYSTGPHCHFEVHLPGNGAVNPMAHLPRGA